VRDTEFVFFFTEGRRLNFLKFNPVLNGFILHVMIVIIAEHSFSK